MFSYIFNEEMIFFGFVVFVLNFCPRIFRFFFHSNAIIYILLHLDEKKTENARTEIKDENHKSEKNHFFIKYI